MKTFYNPFNNKKIYLFGLLSFVMYIVGFFSSYPYLLDGSFKSVNGLDVVRNVIEYGVMFFSIITFCSILYRGNYFFKWIVFLLLLLLGANFMISASCLFIYKQGFNVGMIMSVLDTNLSESLSMSKTLILPIIAAVSFVVLAFVFIRELSNKIYNFKRVPIYLYSFVWVLLPLLFHAKHKYISNKGGGSMIKNVFYHAGDLQKAYNLREELKLITENKVHYNLSPLDSGEELPQNIVILIGESARKQNMSLYGYGRNTTPIAVSEKHNMKIYNNAYSPAAITNLAVPIILSNIDIDNYKENILSISDNIVNVANHQGYDTYWLSTQGGAAGITAIASFSKNKKWIGGFDESLIPELSSVLSLNKNSKKRKVIIMHINGSHPYSCDKYPEKEEYWKFQGQLDNCYDNSIRYTDKVMGEVMKQIEKTNSVLVYVSDHGQIKKDDKYIHGDYREAVQVPFFIWYSPLYKTKNRGVEVNKVVSTSIIYKTVLELMGVSNPKAVNNQGKYLKLDMKAIKYEELK